MDSLLRICLCFRHVTSLLDALPQRFNLAHFYLQDILTMQDVRSERTRSEIFRKDDDFYLQDILTMQNVRSERTRSEIFRKDDDYLHLNY